MSSPLDRLRDIVAQLRSPEGCPWDREQTHQSLKPHLIEECYELIDAIDAADDKGLKEELGDLLLQVVLHSQMASEEKRFDLDDVRRSPALHPSWCESPVLPVRRPLLASASSMSPGECFPGPSRLPNGDENFCARTDAVGGGSRHFASS